MSLTLPQLRALVTVADTGSFTDAAAELRISQSAVSHAIAGLEKELGGKLLERGTPAGLTGRGHRAIDHARAVLQSVDALVSAVKQDDDLTGTVRLGAMATVCQGLVPALMEQWKSVLPGIEVQIYEGDDDELPGWLESGVVDAAILVAPPTEPVGGKLVAIDEFCAVMRTDHPLVELPGIGLPELQEDGLIVSAGGCEGQVRQMHEDEGLPYVYRHRVREISTVFRMVEQGMGVAIVPSLGRVMLPEGLVMRPLDHPRPRRLVLTGPPSRPWHPLAKALVEASLVDPTAEGAAAQDPTLSGPTAAPGPTEAEPTLDAEAALR